MRGKGILPCISIFMPKGIIPRDLRKPRVLKVMAASSSRPTLFMDWAMDSTCLAPWLSTMPAFMALERSISICFKGATSLGQYWVQSTHLTQSHIPCSLLRRSSLFVASPSLTSPTNLHAFASAAGAVNFRSISSALHSELQHPHIMHFWELSIARASSLVTFRGSFVSGGGVRKGVTLSIFFQRGSKSTMRSLSILWFKRGSRRTSPFFLYSGIICVEQASFEKPFTLTAHDPQMADLH